MRNLTSFLLSGAVLAAACSDPGAASEDSDFKMGSLVVEASSFLPLKEISALTRRGREFLAVGDRKASILSFEVDAKGEAVNAVVHDLADKVDIGKHGSQWEAMDTDGTGRVFILSETTGHVLVVHKDLQTVETAFELDLDAARKMVSGSQNANSGDEGMLLLANGHILVMREKAPAALFEMGPKDEAPTGYAPGAAIGSQPFKVPTSKLVPLAVWTFKEPNLAPDVSELTVGPGGALFATTQQGRSLLRLEKNLPPTESKISVRQVYKLPASMKTAEGLSFTEDFSPYVACDLDTKKKNLHRLTKLQ